MNRMIRFAATYGVVALLVAVMALGASAHERRDVAEGQYQMIVGFLDEPAIVGEKNGLDLRVLDLTAPAATPEAGGAAAAAEGAPVEGLADTLQAEVTHGDETMELEISPRFGEPGAYRSVFFPMAEGDYTYRIFGEINGVEIDEEFTSGPETFSAVEPREPLEFPKGDN